MEEIIAKAIEEFVDAYYGESKGDACYNIDEMAKYIALKLKGENK